MACRETVGIPGNHNMSIAIFGVEIIEILPFS